MSAGSPRGGLTAGEGWLGVGLVAVVVLVLDQVTKALVRSHVSVGETDEVLPFLDIGHVHNDGVAFGFLGGGGALLVVIMLAALTLLLGFFARQPARPMLWLPTGMLLGGAVGNLLDRFRQGYVTDFIELPHWPSFNVADVSITLGVVVLVLVLERNARSAAA